MTSRRVPMGPEAAGRAVRTVTVSLDGAPCTGVYGQSLAAVLLGAGRLSWRPGPSDAPRGVFCGIGVCFDCLVTVNGQRDVRACRRAAEEGDVLTTQPREEGDPHEDGCPGLAGGPARGGSPDAEERPTGEGGSTNGSRANASDVNGPQRSRPGFDRPNANGPNVGEPNIEGPNANGWYVNGSEGVGR